MDPLAGKYKQLTPYQNAGNDPIGDFDIDGMQGNKTVPDNPQDNTPDNADYFSKIPESERYNQNYEGYKSLNMNEGDNISFNIEKSQAFKISEEGIPTEKETEKKDFNFKDDDFWEVEPTYTQDEVKTLGRYGTSEGMNKLIKVMAKTIAKTHPALGMFLEVINPGIDLEKKEFKLGPSIPGGDLIDYNMMILDIKVKGRLHTLGDGSSLKAPLIDFGSGETIGVKQYRNENGKIKTYEFKPKKILNIKLKS